MDTTYSLPGPPPDGRYCTDGASRKPEVNGRRASTKAGAASLLPLMCCCQILAILLCLCLRRSRSTSTTSRTKSTTTPGIPASRAIGSHGGAEGPADGGVLGGLGPAASLSASTCMINCAEITGEPNFDSETRP